MLSNKVWDTQDTRDYLSPIMRDEGIIRSIPCIGGPMEGKSVSCMWPPPKGSHKLFVLTGKSFGKGYRHVYRPVDDRLEYVGKEQIEVSNAGV